MPSKIWKVPTSIDPNVLDSIICISTLLRDHIRIGRFLNKQLSEWVYIIINKRDLEEMEAVLQILPPESQIFNELSEAIHNQKRRLENEQEPNRTCP